MKKAPTTARGVQASSAIIAQYQKSLVKLIGEMHNSVLYWIKAVYGRREDEIAMDASPSREIDDELRRLNTQWNKKFREYARKHARWFGRSVNRDTTYRVLSSLKALGYVVAFTNTHDVNNAMQSIIAGNVNLIKSIPSQYFTDITTTIMQGIQNGRDLGFITDQIESRYHKTRDRAIVIARDQTHKASVAISERRFESLGITDGIWVHTSGSKVPRDTHIKMNGQQYKIAEGLFDPAVKRLVKPASEVNCRCYFKPVIPGLGDNA